MKAFYTATFLFIFLSGWGIYLAKTYTPTEMVVMDAGSSIPQGTQTIPPVSGVPQDEIAQGATPVTNPVPPPPPPVVKSPAKKTTTSITPQSSPAPVGIPKSSSPSQDTTSPTMPENLITTSAHMEQINIAWGKSTDNISVVGYRVYRNGVEIGTTIDTFYADIDLSAASIYTYFVSAYDRAGNESLHSNTIAVEKGAVILAVAPSTPPPTPVSTPVSSPTPTPTPVPTPTPTSNPTPTPTPAPTPSPTPTPTPPSAPSSCAGTTINSCVLATIASGGSSGSCTSGYTGSCNYTCNNGTWNQNSNSCALPPAPPPPPPSPAVGCGSGGVCTAADIAPHNSRANCWVYLSPLNKAYDITSYVANGNTHPGGDVIVPYCGANMYNYFIGTAGGHKHSNTALNSVLQAYYIGVFQ